MMIIEITNTESSVTMNFPIEDTDSAESATKKILGAIEWFKEVNKND